MEFQAQTPCEGQTLVGPDFGGSLITNSGGERVAIVDSERDDETIRLLRVQPPGEYQISDWRCTVTVKSGGRLVYSC